MLLRNKKEIEEWLKKYDIKYYKLIEDKEYGYVVNVNQSVYLGCKSLNLLKVKFNEIDGSFNCEKNILKSLEGCPKKVNGYFDCSYNKLKSLVGGPEYVRGGFYCNDNQLTSLEGCPEIVNGSFDCVNNKLNSIQGCPKIIDGNFDCSDNELTSLVGCSEIIQEEFYCNNNKFDNLKDLISLINIDVKTNYIDLSDNPKLGKLQDIDDFNEIKRMLNIYQEKENLDNFINKAIESADVIFVAEKINKI